MLYYEIYDNNRYILNFVEVWPSVEICHQVGSDFNIIELIYYELLYLIWLLTVYTPYIPILLHTALS